jgi:hypothetical protein
VLRTCRAVHSFVEATSLLSSNARDRTEPISPQRSARFSSFFFCFEPLLLRDPRMSSVPWFVRAKAAGESFFDEIDVRPSFLPTTNCFADANGSSIASAHQVNGVMQPPAIGVSTKLTNSRFWPPKTTGSGASTAGDATIATRILLTGADVVADAQTQYSNWSSNAVGAALVVMRIPTAAGNHTFPVLACVHCPIVMRRGHTVQDPWAEPSFAPGGDPTPKNTVFTMAATINHNHNQRKSAPTFDPLDQGIIVGFLHEQSFKPVITLSTVASMERATMNQNAGNSPGYTTLWHTKDDFATALANVNHTHTQSFKDAEADDMAVILPKILPLSSLCIIPPGIICRLNGVNTVEKLRDILRFFLQPGDRGSLSMLDFSPLLHEWLHAAHADPLTFLTNWTAFADIKNSFSLTHQYQTWQEDYDPAPFKEQQFAFLFQQMMRSLAWHIHLDWARAGPGTNPKDLQTKRFENWLHLAYQTAFSLASTPLGHAPIEHTGELPFLRPLSKRTLLVTFDLEKFMTKDYYLPLMATLYLTLPVDPYIASNFQNVQLCTQAEADDAIANAAAAEQPEEADLTATPGMMAFHSSVQKQRLADTISVFTPRAAKNAPAIQRLWSRPHFTHRVSTSPQHHTDSRFAAISGNIPNAAAAV